MKFIINRKILFYFLVSVIIFIVFVIFAISTFQTFPKLPPSISPTPSIIIKPSVVIPTDKLEQYNLELNYAKERQRALEDKTWLLKMPLESSEYFIIYNTETNEFKGVIYYDKYATEENKIAQLSYAKKHALNAIKNLGVDLNKEKVILEERGI